MSLIDKKVFEEFSTWAEEKRDGIIFPEISKDEKTYFVDRRSEETYIMEYSFKTLPELRCGLEEYSGLSTDPHALKMLTVEICRNRYKSNLQMNQSQKVCSIDSKENNKEIMPDYVYVF